jgi:hypothetical protein
MSDDRMQPMIDTLEVRDRVRQSGGDWWLIWNIVIVLIGVSVVAHWFRLTEEGHFFPGFQQITELYAFQITMLRDAISKLPLIYVTSEFLDYLVMGGLFSLVSLRATGPTGPGQDWPASGKLSDWAFHFALWPLILFFYVTSIFRIVQLVDRERLQFVRTTLLAFLLIAPVASLLILIRDLGFFWTAVG